MPNIRRLSAPMNHYNARPGDKAVSRLCGFDIVRALNLLLELAHANDSDAKRRAGAFEAHMRVFHVRAGLGTERLSEQRYLEDIIAVRRVLRRLMKTATEREAIELELEAHTVGSRPRPRPFRLTQGVLRLGAALDRYLRVLERMWDFDSEGRTLPGTRRVRGAKPKNLLGEVEEALSGSGFSQHEIAELDLDGTLRPDKFEDAEQRVRDRARAQRKRRKKWE